VPDLSTAELALVIATALLAGTIGGITGLGTAIIALPVFTVVFGVREAIPVVSVAMLLNTLSRAVANRDYIDWRVVRWFAIGSVPAAVLGGVAFANAPADILVRALGGFLLLLVAWRHLPKGARRSQMDVHRFVPAGAGQGFLSAVFGGAGPFGAHFYLEYGLVRNSFIGTVAVGTLIINIAKVSVYSGYTILDVPLFALASGLGLVMGAGAYAGATIVKHVSERVFTYLVEAVMVVAGIMLIVQG
jgi:uncharacterized membrane protein YfcA